MYPLVRTIVSSAVVLLIAVAQGTAQADQLVAWLRDVTALDQSSAGDLESQNAGRQAQADSAPAPISSVQVSGSPVDSKPTVLPPPMGGLSSGEKWPH